MADNNTIIGKVNMQGSILETACAISMDSYDQSIDMGVIPMSLINQYGNSPIKYFSIKLIGCHLETLSGKHWNYFTLTFDGPAKNNLFELFGHAKGISLSLEDEKGNLIYPSVPLKEHSIIPGESNLKYGVKLMRNGLSLKSGGYRTTIKFKVDYHWRYLKFIFG
ncbi:fimbrial protein [Providencia sp. CRE-138-0111]|uniref:Fimbrial protein n=2 Tax=Providencia huashanensis TaxID=3037798 RepID=A0ABT9AR65_9GAMM|nr:MULTISPECIES: fimbrial protein [unclassified Providencia]MDO7832377.1 fimbrial protein [Providencia sp. CRE-138-0026]MDO7856787.1 fimbrial protein [Providencia sp. CRE-138-0111]